MRLLCLAPGGGCLAADIAADAGSLLHYRFTLAAQDSRPTRQYTSLLPYSIGSPRPAVSRHRYPVEGGLSSMWTCHTAIT